MACANPSPQQHGFDHRSILHASYRVQKVLGGKNPDQLIHRELTFMVPPNHLWYKLPRYRTAGRNPLDDGSFSKQRVDSDVDTHLGRDRGAKLEESSVVSERVHECLDDIGDAGRLTARNGISISCLQREYDKLAQQEKVDGFGVCG